MNEYQREVYRNLANFLVRFLPRVQQESYTKAFLSNQIRGELINARVVDRYGEIDPDRVNRVMKRRHGVKMPSFSDEAWGDVEEGESP